jgi:hypothetical protein
VKRILVVIFSLIAMMIIMSHDIIPHYHHDDDIETVARHLPDHRSDKDSEHNHKSHFPPHQHYFSDEDFFFQRNPISLNRYLKEQQQDNVWGNSPATYSDEDFILTGFIREIRGPLNPLLIILPCNLTRGSPFIS